MATVEQSYKNHGRIVPQYLGSLVILAINVIVVVVAMFRYGVTLDNVWAVLVALALFLSIASLRTQTLTVQDRVIRLESRLRMRELLPPDVAARAADLPIKQLVAIRFASDGELPELVGDVLAGKLTEPKAIKQAIKQWQADHLRA
jgi:hypothetical protein